MCAQSSAQAVVIDGNKVVLSVLGPETRVDDAEFRENEVYAIDIVANTGEGKPRLLDEKQITVYKKTVGESYHLKMKASRFSSALEEKRARLGLVECVNHKLLQPYPILHQKFTILLMPYGSDRITSHALQKVQPTKTLDEEPEIKAYLALGTKSKKKGGGKKKKGIVTFLCFGDDTGKKGDKAKESTEAEPMDATTASQE
ncbi:hypothetical protein MKX01_022948 [Papaver californicum]|nr:hypothetical protein MKX01_022948 [Papaver californicum]